MTEGCLFLLLLRHSTELVRRFLINHQISCSKKLQSSVWARSVTTSAQVAAQLSLGSSHFRAQQQKPEKCWSRLSTLRRRPARSELMIASRAQSAVNCELSVNQRHIRDYWFLSVYFSVNRTLPHFLSFYSHVYLFSPPYLLSWYSDFITM